MMRNEESRKAERVSSSFRDPGGFVYRLNDTIYRQINPSGHDDYQQLMKSGLYERLTSLGYLVSHEEVDVNLAANNYAVVVLKPEKINFISYPYEWCFSQLKNSALLTLETAKIALDFNMLLKDATAYNVQFHHGRPIFIDTGSFEEYREGEPWVAYQQFCKHFLAPLALMSKKDIRLGLLTKEYIDGIPLDLTSWLLPFKSWFSLSLFAHIHAHAKTQAKYSNALQTATDDRKVSKMGLCGLLDNLGSLVNSLEWQFGKTEWGDYYSQTNYSDNATAHKTEIIHKFISNVKPAIVWDLGGNNGYYSRIAASTATEVISFDIDPVAVEKNYRKIVEENSKSILPLLLDLTNPSPAIGWANSERDSLQGRGPPDLIMALALIHHLAISNNVPLDRIAAYFSSLGEYLLIEFVPKEDTQVQRLLASRKDIFVEYNISAFKHAFSLYYDILNEASVKETHRCIYLMKRKPLKNSRIKGQ